MGYTDYPCGEAQLVPVLISQPPPLPQANPGKIGNFMGKGTTFVFKSCRIGTIFNGFSAGKDVLKEQFAKNLT